MTVLNRNQPRSSVAVDISEEQGVKEVSPTTFDPLSPHYQMPDWLVATPWSLAYYFQQCIERRIIAGETRILVHDIYGELRPAKELLTKCGLELACRVVKYTADTVSGPVTLWRAIERIEEVRKCIPKKRLKPLDK